MYGYGSGDGSIRAITSSYAIERTQEGGDQGYNGIDDWNYVDGLGDLDECNGRFGPTPEYPEGIYHYVSTPLSGSPTLVTDTNGDQVGMIGFPYFLLCYHGVANLDSQSVGGDREVDHQEVDHPVKMASNTGMVSCPRISIGRHQMVEWNFQHPR